MLSGVPEWFAKRLIFEKIKRWLFSNDNDENREDELYETFVVQYEGFNLTEPTESEHLKEIEEDLHGEVVNLYVIGEGSYRR